MMMMFLSFVLMYMRAASIKMRKNFYSSNVCVMFKNESAHARCCFINIDLSPTSLRSCPRPRPG